MKYNFKVYYFLVKWIPPPGWNSPESYKFWSFNTLVNLNLLEGNEISDYNALVEGKVSVANYSHNSFLPMFRPQYSNHPHRHLFTMLFYPFKPQHCMI